MSIKWGDDIFMQSAVAESELVYRDRLISLWCDLWWILCIKKGSIKTEILSYLREGSAAFSWETYPLGALFLLRYRNTYVWIGTVWSNISTNIEESYAASRVRFKIISCVIAECIHPIPIYKFQIISSHPFIANLTAQELQLW